LNYLHRRFSAVCFDTPNYSLLEIKRAIDRGAKIVVSDGFLQRNAAIAYYCDWVVAYTLGTMEYSPGTLHTWSLCRKKAKAHFDVYSLAEKKG
jgi:hypothetical protein